MRQWIEVASNGIELLAVAVIVGSVAFGSVRFLLDLSSRATDPYSPYKNASSAGIADRWRFGKSAKCVI